MTSPPVATTNDGTQHKGHILRLGIDLGTGHLSIDGQHIQGANWCDPLPLRLKNRYGGTSIKQIAIYQEDGNVIYGYEDVTNALKEHPELRGSEIERFKLALHPEFAHLDEVKHVLRVLHAKDDRGALQLFYSDFIRTITKDVRNSYMRFYHAGMDARHWNSIPLELQISVPAMWNDDTRGIIRNAAKMGGAWRAELREEPLCVATAYMVNMVKDRNIQAGQSLLLIDCGQGTLDIATVKLVREPRGEQLMELARVGVCSGSSAGSHKVNTAAEQWLLSGGCEEIESRGFKETCEQLGLSRREFLRAFSDGIDKVKVDIDSRQNVFDVRIHGPYGEARPGSLYQVTVSVPRTPIMLWYKTWTDLAMNLLEQHLSAQSGAASSQFAWALFTGGGTESPQFCKEMETVFSKYNVLVGESRPASRHVHQEPFCSISSKKMPSQ